MSERKTLDPGGEMAEKWLRNLENREKDTGNAREM